VIINPYIFSSSADPYWDRVRLLQNFEGANASTAFYDDVSGDPWSFSGPTISTDQAKFGSTCGKFAASNAYLDSPCAAFNKNDFTIECFVYLTATSASLGAFIFDMRPTGQNGAYPALYILNGAVRYYVNTADQITQASGMSTGAWHHVALCRASGVTKLFVDGTQVGSNYTDTNVYQGYKMRVGANQNNIGASAFALGYMDAFRVTVGVARYTAAFTPPSVPYLQGPRYDPWFGQVAALMHMDTPADTSGHISDQTGKVYAINGNAAISTLQKKFGAASASFDASLTSHIDSPLSGEFSFFAGDLTIEMWVYKPTFTTQYNFFEVNTTQGANPSDRIVLYFPNASANPRFFNNSDRISSSIAVSANTWTHIALTRESAASNNMQLFINGASAGTVSLGTSFQEGRIRIGGDGTTAAINGYIDELRITKGVCRYSAPFPAPNQPHADVLAGNTSDLLSNIVKSLMNMRGSSGATSLIDEKARTWTTGGDVKIDTTQGFNAAVFDGTGDSLTTANVQADFDWWIDDYTIEAWIKASSFSSWEYIDGSNHNPRLHGNMTAASSTSNYWSFGPIAGGQLKFYYYNGSSNSVVSTATVPTGQLTHIAMTKAVDGIRMFIDGVLVSGPTAISGTPQSSTGVTQTIGAFNSGSITGYVKATRVTKGKARYLANFTPQAAPYPTF
jgi:hypothetical protein